MTLYRIFDQTMACSFPLPELPLSSTATSQVSISVTLGEWESEFPDGFESIFEWTDDSGRTVCRCARRSDDYLFEFPGRAAFLVSGREHVVCLPRADCEMPMLRHLLLNQILPRVLGARGRLVVHASAVVLPGGIATAGFLGRSGAGKSTLASSFHRHGAQLVSDDALLLEMAGEQVDAIGGPLAIRLYPDSMDAVFHEATGFTPLSPYSSKQQLLLAEQAMAMGLDSRQLDAMFLLDDSKANVEKTSIEPLSGSEAMMALLSCVFALDPSDREMIVSGFRGVGEAVSRRLRFFRLAYPKRLDRLHEVRGAVAAALEDLS
jgi:hypothetical protein